MITNIWPKKKITWLFDVIGSGTTPSASNEVYYNSPDMAWLNTGDLTDSYVEQTSKYVSKQALKDFSALAVFPKESLIMAMYGATIGKLGITKYETTTNQACCVLGQPKGITTKFTFYWLMGHRSEIINLSQGGGQPNISQGIIRNIRIAVPPLELQNKIVAFIDKKFDETNLLISRKEQMIKLLEQQRQSIITEVVTKGLNPNVKMKDSGVEWIGEIPEHWHKGKVKLFYDVVLGKMLQPIRKEASDELVKYFKAANVQNRYLSNNKDDFMYASNHDIKNLNLLKGDLLVCEGGEVGRSVILQKDYPNTIYQNSLHRVRGKEGNDNRFLMFLLNVVRNTNFINLLVSKATIAHFTKDKFESLQICLPPLEEQQYISDYLERKSNEIDELKKLLMKQIDNLKEYRQSLIYEAVTGKIDVRDMKLD